MAWRALATGTAPGRLFQVARRTGRVPHHRACSALKAADSERDFVLRGVHADHKVIVARAVEQATRASEQWSVALSDFVEPPVASDIVLAVGRLADCEARPFGGYEHAERVRLRLGRPDVLDGEPLDSAVSVVNVSGNFIFDTATHRDFLGAILGTGIERSRVGDIVLQSDRGAHVLTTPEMAAYFVQGSLSQVRSVPVVCSIIPLSELRVTAPKKETIRTSEASLRLDAIASAGFRVSRAIMSELIDGGDLKLNWKADPKPSQVVKSGDVISVRGKGRVTVGEISLTKKERYSVELHRLV